MQRMLASVAVDRVSAIPIKFLYMVLSFMVKDLQKILLVALPSFVGAFQELFECANHLWYVQLLATKLRNVQIMMATPARRVFSSINILKSQLLM